MRVMKENQIVIRSELEIQSRILTLRDVQVMLDRDLAELYGVEAKQLNRQVKRNAARFPADFMFQLTQDETNALRCQIGTSKRGGDRYRPYAFHDRFLIVDGHRLYLLGASLKDLGKKCFAFARLDAANIDAILAKIR